jgi:hypothetical protein
MPVYYCLRGVGGVVKNRYLSKVGKMIKDW